MIIVNQDKTEVFNFSEIFRLFVDTWSNEEFAIEPNCYCIKAEKASDNLICAFLGEYATEERAKEVLSEIIKCYEMTEFYKVAAGVDQEYIQDNSSIFKYEMPEN